MDWSKPFLNVASILQILENIRLYNGIKNNELNLIFSVPPYPSPKIVINTVTLLQELKLIYISKGKFKTHLKSDEKIESVLVIQLKKSIADENLYEILNGYADGDLDSKGRLSFPRVRVVKSHIGLLALLVGLNLLGYNQQTDCYYLSNDDFLFPSIVKDAHKNYREKSLEELELDLERNKRIGELAEIEALTYECNMLPNKAPLRISEVFVNAGYDLVSFMSNDSMNFDKFIEVKAMTESNHFFLSRNEVIVSQQKADNYFLYLVNLSNNTLDADDHITIIQNPFKVLMENDSDWVRSVESYRFEK